MDKLIIQQDKIEDIVILNPSGRIDAETYTIMRDEIEKLFLENKYKIIINLQNIEYISSAGWGSFIGYVNTARNKKGDIKLANMVGEVKRVYEMIEFKELIEAYNTIEEAKLAFK
jgi:anti-sigma B factor antagonist